MNKNERVKELEKLEEIGKNIVANKAIPTSRKKTEPAYVSGKTSSKTMMRRFDQIQSKPIKWLWPGRIACGKITLLAGDPGLGKSQVTAALAGIVTTGGAWPVDLNQCRFGAVIFLSAEDDAGDTIKPRLEAVNADLSQCFILDAIQDTDQTGTMRRRSISLKNDLPRLAGIIRDIGNVRLIVIDPLTAYLDGVNSHTNADVRAEIMAPLAEFAEQNNVAVMGVMHLNKSNNQGAMARINGSGAFVAAARAAFLLVKDKNAPERLLLLPLKNNIAKDSSGLAFSINDVQLGNGIATSRISWEPKPVNITADEALNQAVNTNTSNQLEEVKSFLFDILRNGPLSANDVKNEAEELGFSWSTVRRAKEQLGIKPDRESYNGKWFWSLPDEAKKSGAQKSHAQAPCITNEHVTQTYASQGFEQGKSESGAQPNNMSPLGNKNPEIKPDLEPETNAII